MREGASMAGRRCAAAADEEGDAGADFATNLRHYFIQRALGGDRVTVDGQQLVAR